MSKEDNIEHSDASKAWAIIDGHYRCQDLRRCRRIRWPESHASSVTILIRTITEAMDGPGYSSLSGLQPRTKLCMSPVPESFDQLIVLAVLVLSTFLADRLVKATACQLVRSGRSCPELVVGALLGVYLLVIGRDIDEEPVEEAELPD